VFAVPRLPAERRGFYRLTCGLLMGAVLGFAFVSALLLKTGAAWWMLAALGHSRVVWLALPAAFLLLGWWAVGVLDRPETAARRAAALALAVLADSLLFAPIFARVQATLLGLIASIVVVALVIGCSVAWAAFGPPRAPAWLDRVLTLGGVALLAAIVAAVALRHPLGLWAASAGVAGAALVLTHHGAQVLRASPVDRPGGAALNLFASSSLVLWLIRSVAPREVRRG
jgi:hypothetical protein